MEDKLGNKIEIGDWIAHAASSYKTAIMRFGKVEKFTKEGFTIRNGTDVSVVKKTFMCINLSKWRDRECEREWKELCDAE